MLKKLLKYDFKSLFKYWWIVAIASVALSVLAGECITILESERDFHEVLQVASGIVIMLAIIGIVVFAVFSTVMIFIRYYKNLFTDEGYLTFTLPVKRSNILNSKVISATVLEFATLFVIAFDVLFMLIIGFAERIFKKEFFEAVKNIVTDIFDTFGGYVFIYLLEAFLILIALSVLSILFLYICITLGSIIAKKAKVITSIGIYYAANSVFMFVMQLLFIFGAVSLDAKFSNMTNDSIKLIIALIALCILMFTVMIGGILYIVEYYMLDRKLNLT